MRVFSAVQPTGKIHIGNYLSAIKNWLRLQKEFECFFSIADLHAITVPYEAETLKKAVLKTLVVYLACGLNPEKSVIFLQSQVKEHTELSWLLSTITPLGELQRMTQFKDKARKVKREKRGVINAGLLNYPVLMAADILLYKTDLVPVGKDQQQHVELTRLIARKFNKLFGETFKIPKTKVPKIGAKIMSLTEPTKKMSKSDSNPNSCIYLLDSAEEIQRKIKKAVTDTGKKIRYDPKSKPGISNLLTIYSLFENIPIKEAERRFQNKNYQTFKKEVAKALIKHLTPLQGRVKELKKREGYLKEVLEEGRKKAQKVAASTMEEVKRKMGLVP